MSPSPRLAVVVWTLVLALVQAGCGEDERGSGGSSSGGHAGQAGGGQAGRGGAPPPGGQGGIDWTQSGYPGEIPNVDQNVIDVPCSGSDDHAAIQAAIDSASSPAVILLPAGTCRIESRLDLQSGVVLRGRGSEQTLLECHATDGCIYIGGAHDGDWVAIQSDPAQGATQITVADAAGFGVGAGAQIRQDDIIPAAASWGEDAVGQMAKVTAIEGNTLTIEPALHLAYDSNANPVARPIRYVEQVGIEDLHLLRIDAGGDSESNVRIRWAADSWVRRVQSEYTEKYHFAVSEALHIEIRDSYIHDAKCRCGGGQGYAVSLGRAATSVLVENNIFSDATTAMMIQLGASGNVLSYNYSQRIYSDEDGRDNSHITFHGHYPFMNLCEANILAWSKVDDIWGVNGPGNTYFRNRLLGTDGAMGFGSQEGLYFADGGHHGTQYVIGNEIDGEDGIYGDLSEVVIHGNDVNGEVIWDPTIPDHTLPDSYYLTSKPSFYGALDWPSTGGDMPDGTIPAMERWASGALVPQP